MYFRSKNPMISLCPVPKCEGPMYKRGKGRSPVCYYCGYCEPLQRGRPRKDPDRPVSDRDIYLAKKTAPDRQVKYALFDPLKVPEGSIGKIHRETLVDVVVGCSRQSVEKSRPGLIALRIGKLAAWKKRWVEEFESNRSPEN